MAIDSLSDTPRIGRMLDLWTQKIQAHQDRDSKNTTVTPDGKIRVTSPGAMKVGNAKETEPTDNDDEYTRLIKELQRRLKRIMAQIEHVQASNASAEQKAAQRQLLNSQAMQIMGQIQKILTEQAKALAKASGKAAA